MIYVTDQQTKIIDIYAPSIIQSSAPTPSKEERPCYAHLTNLVTLFFTWPMPTHASSPVTIPPFAVLNLMPKPPLGPPGSWLAVRIIPPMALHFLIKQEMAGVDMIPCCPMTKRPTWVTEGCCHSHIKSFNGQQVFFFIFKPFLGHTSLLLWRNTNTLW